MAETKRIEPQDGFQKDFLSCSADIAIGGGSAGAGKTFSLLTEPLRHYQNPKFGAVFFRRSVPQIKNIGGLWDESTNLYQPMGFKSNLSELKWQAPMGATYKFAHLQYEDTVYEWQGAQVPFFAFDELTHFTKKQFWYLVSRNRSVCGVNPYVRATCNPDPESWVAELIAWWINQETGFPIPERSGKIRYLTQDKNKYVFGDTIDEVLKQIPHILEELPSDLNPRTLVKSLTFIPGTIYQNKKLMETNPEYIGNLLSLPEHERRQLLQGNWKIPVDGLSLFEYSPVNDLFTNFIEHIDDKYYITCDVARFGADLAVIYVWEGMEVIEISIFTKCKIDSLNEEITRFRKKYAGHISNSNVVIDQDGVGGGLVDYGGFCGFSGNASPINNEDAQGRILKENYKNFKTQCYYLFAEKVNLNQARINVSEENCVIDGRNSTRLNYHGEEMQVRDLIKKQLRAIKKKSRDSDQRLQINSKDEQKIILNGQSPDFSDALMMRMFFEIKKESEPNIWLMG